MTLDNGDAPARTVLEQRIRERRLTFEEFVEFAETFARQHNESGTVSVRHLQRLAAGRGAHGRPLGKPRAATARLLERIFETSIDVLLSPPETNAALSNESDVELRQLLRASAQIDNSVLTLLRGQLAGTRRLDRQLGAIVAHDEVLAKITQVTQLLDHSLTPSTRMQLAGHLSELHALAGWQALDTGNVTGSWNHYTRAMKAAAQGADPAFAVHSAAGQAFTLIDLGDTANAAALVQATRDRTQHRTDKLIRSWLAAAHGEALAADQRRDESLRAFDEAHGLLPDDPSPAETGPYVVLDAVHLGRWRGHALARLGEPTAVDTLTSALDRLDRTFTRAETALRVDLATAYTAIGERDEARRHVNCAKLLATEIGSKRQRRRIRMLN